MGSLKGTGGIPLVRAERYAAQFIALIEDACERVQVAGAIRRREARVDAIDVLAAPKCVDVLDMFATFLHQRDLLDEVMLRLLENERVLRPGTKSKDPWTIHPRSLTFVADDGARASINVFWTTPASWGTALAMLTGPPSLTAAMQTRVGRVAWGGRAGLLPSEYRIGTPWMLLDAASDAQIPTPHEQDFLSVLWEDVAERPERRR